MIRLIFFTMVIIAGVITSFLCGHFVAYISEYDVPVKVETPCYGYVVIDASHIIDCDGDTIVYKWQRLKRAN